MKTSNDAAFEPEPRDDVAQGLAEMESFLATQAPQPPAKTAKRGIEEPAPDFVAPSGYTKRVQLLAGELAEADAMLGLLSVGDPRLDVPTSGEQRTLRKAAGAMRMHQLSQTPALVAARDAKVRRWATGAALVSAVMALAWSTAGVQASVAKSGDLAAFSPGWVLAWLVEPMMSLLLLALVGGQAYAAIRGRPIDRDSETGRIVSRIEWALLGLTLTLNVWPYLPGVARGFNPLQVLVHALGPIVAVLAVKGLPALYSMLDALPLPKAGATRGATEGATAPSYSANTPSAFAVHMGKTQALIAAGRLPSAPSATQVQKLTRCGTEIAREIRDELQKEGGLS